MVGLTVSLSARYMIPLLTSQQCLTNISAYPCLHLYHCRIFIHCIKSCRFIWDNCNCRHCRSLPSLAGLTWLFLYVLWL